MTGVAGCLLLYSVTVVVAAPPLLRTSATARTPGLAVGVWIAAIASVLASWASAAVLLAAEAFLAWDEPRAVLTSCVRLLHLVAGDNAGTAAQVALLASAGTALIASAIATIRLAQSLIRMRRHTLAHASEVRLVGDAVSRHSATDAARNTRTVVVSASQPAAYCIPGRPGTIVVTTAAVTVLTERQLDAVIAHERAHLSGRHPQLVAAVRLLAARFSAVALIRDAAQRIPLLLEMRADDVAARDHGTEPLLSGLVALTEASAMPATALSAAGVGVLERAQRLTGDRHRGFKVRSAVLATFAVCALLPLAIGGLAIYDALPCI